MKIATFHVLCGTPMPWGRATVSIQAIDTTDERTAARIACERFGWQVAKVRRSSAPQVGGLYTFTRYAANGRRMG